MTTPLKIDASAETGPVGIAIEASGLAFDLEAKAGDGAAKLPTFAMVGYTGAPVNLGNFFSPVIIDLAGFKARSQEIPALRDHDQRRIVGQTDTVKIDAKGVRLTGKITGENGDAREVLTQAKNGFKWQASIGASADRREFLEAGKTTTVNGRDVSGPMTIVREATLGEISFVAIGADGATSASVSASKPSGLPLGDSTMTFETWLQARGIDPAAALPDAVKATLKAQYDAEQAPKPVPPPAPAPPPAAPAPAAPSLSMTLDQIVKAQRDEEFRVAEITRITAEVIARRPALLDRIEALAKAAIEGKSTVAEFEVASLRLRAESGPAAHAIHAHGGGDARTSQSMIEAAICKSGRLENIDKHFDSRTLEAADKHFRYGIGLQEFLLIGARENGFSGHSAHDVRGMLRAAFPMDVRAEGFSNISIPGILSNVMNKFLVDYFNAVESAWREITAIRNVRDFKQVSSYSLTGDLTYELVGPTGEIKSGTLGQASYTNQASTYAKLLAVTRQDIINDDLGALMRIPQRLGRGAALKLNDVIWTAFLAGVGSFWASGNANLISGGTTTLTAVGLTAALLKFRQQTDPDGKPLGLTPKVLLTPPELEVTGKQLMNSAFFNTGGSATTAQVPNQNTWQGAYRQATSTYLSNSSYTGYSTTAWWLLADPADLPTIELAVLNGREVPIIESAEAEFDTLGIKVRGYHDFGASLQEPRGSVRSAGT